MPLQVSYLVDDSALKIGDPNKTRVRLAEWTLFYNQSTRELSEKADVMQYRATFNLLTTTPQPYPEEMTRMTFLEATETPSDNDSWREVTEIFEDEFRAQTSSAYPSATLPDHYFAEKSWLWLIGRPTATIAGGGRITYFGLPDRITDTQVALYQLPMFTQDYVIRRMVIFAKMARNRIAEAEAELRQWYTDVEGLQGKMDDRSDDRRSGLRTKRARFAGMR